MTRVQRSPHSPSPVGRRLGLAMIALTIFALFGAASLVAPSLLGSGVAHAKGGADNGTPDQGHGDAPGTAGDAGHHGGGGGGEGAGHR